MRPKFNPGLRVRVTVGFALLGIAVSVALGAGLYTASRELEQRLIDEALGAELQDYQARLARNPDSLPPMTATVRGYRERAGEATEEIPAELESLPAGRYTVSLEGIPYRVAVSGPDGRRLYMLHNRAAVDYRAQQFLLFVLVGVALTGLLSAAGGWWLAGRVIAPVSELARRVRERAATDLDTPLAQGLPTDEVGEMGRAFERYLARLRAFLDRERAFAADASHELRTPLAIVQGAVEVLLADPDLDPRRRTRVARIERAARSMGELTTALLMLAREAPSGSPEAPPYPVEEVLREVLEHHRPLLQGKPVTLEVTVEAHPEVRAARPLLAIALGNLVRNAFAYTERGQVRVRLASDRVTVQDTGPGIPAEEIGRLLERTARARRGTRGAGVGLPLVKRIADHQGWRITVTSEAGQGATFSLYFTPVAGPVPPP
jgi:signal transduction histidine kinase